MATMLPGQVHINKFLTDFSLQIRPGGLIARDVFPVKNVAFQTDLYPIYNQADWLRQAETSRAPREKPKMSFFSVSSDQYTAVNRAHGTEVDYETQDNSDDPFRPLQDGVEYLRYVLDLDFEIKVEATTSSGVGSSATLTGVNAWDQYGTSKPLVDIRNGRQAIRGTTGLRPNVAIIPQKVADVLQDHPALIRAAFPGGAGGGLVTTDILPRLFQVDRVLIPDMVKNTGTRGLTDTYVDVWSTNVSLLYVNPNPGLKVATFGAAFHWTGPKIGRSGPTNWQVYQTEDEEAGCTRMWTGYYQDEKVTASQLGYQILTGIS